MSKSQDIIAFFQASPNNLKTSVDEVAKKFGVRKPTVYALRRRAQGLTVKRPTRGQKVLRQHITDEAVKTDQQSRQFAALIMRNTVLEDENRSLKAVVAYLEKKVFDGASV